MLQFKCTSCSGYNFLYRLTPTHYSYHYTCKVVIDIHDLFHIPNSLIPNEMGSGNICVLLPICICRA